MFSFDSLSRHVNAFVPFRVLCRLYFLLPFPFFSSFCHFDFLFGPLYIHCFFFFYYFLLSFAFMSLFKLLFALFFVQHVVLVGRLPRGSRFLRRQLRLSRDGNRECCSSSSPSSSAIITYTTKWRRHKHRPGKWNSFPHIPSTQSVRLPIPTHTYMPPWQLHPAPWKSNWRVL